MSIDVNPLIVFLRLVLVVLLRLFSLNHHGTLRMSIPGLQLVCQLDRNRDHMKRRNRNQGTNVPRSPFVVQLVCFVVEHVAPASGGCKSPDLRLSPHWIEFRGVARGVVSWECRNAESRESQSRRNRNQGTDVPRSPGGGWCVLGNGLYETQGRSQLTPECHSFCEIIRCGFVHPKSPTMRGMQPSFSECRCI